MLSSMSDLIYPLLGLGLLLLLLLALIVVRRRRARAAAADDLAPVIVSGDSLDYTALDVQEPLTWRERFAQLPPALRALAGALLLLLLLGLGGLVWALGNTSTANTPPATPVPASEITITDAVVSSPNEIGISARTNLPDGTLVAAGLSMDGQDFRWYTNDSAQGEVRNGRIDLTLRRAEDAPLPELGRAFQVVVASSGVNPVTARANLVVPPTYTDAFYGIAATPQPTAAPTAPQPTPNATTAPTEAPTSAPTTPAVQTYAASVFNGGNVRAQPSLEGDVIGGINAGEPVTITQKTESGEWYFLETIRGEQGWVSATLLTIDAGVAAQVPILGQAPAPVPTEGATPEPGTLTATVFNGGNVRAQPNLSGRVVGGINANETVTLLQKTSSGQWYQIRTPRGEEGWVSVTLLTISGTVRDQVPVADGSPPTDASTGAALSATVFNGGNVRDQPNLSGAVVGGINANETVTLLQKTVDAQWYRVRTIRDEEGWVSASLLTISPSVAAQVPVA
jgi:uncharacterized protein YgiM (DUF1202 family)